MTEENKEVDKVETKPETKVESKPETISIDLHGVTVDLPIEKAKILIEKRDLGKNQLKELQDKLTIFAQEKDAAAKKVQALELAKNQDMEALEKVMSEKYTTKLSTLERAVVHNSIKATLVSNQNFIGDQAALNDAVTLLVASNNFQRSEEHTSELQSR